MTNPAYKLANAEPEQIKSAELKFLFKQQIELEDYQKLSHFIWVKQIKEHIPGTYSVYSMYKDGIAIGTNALCINAWLDTHNLPRKRPLSEYTVKQKMLFNREDVAKIDNRTDSTSVVLKRKPGRVQGKRYEESRCGINVREQIWDLHQEGFTPADISHAIGCTPANVYYHINKERKRLDKLKD
jgi:hypothetical protein